jgi:DNA-binding MarR family transcriptional regulator
MNGINHVRSLTTSTFHHPKHLAEARAVSNPSGEFIATMYVFADQLRQEYDQAAAHAGLTGQQAIVLTLLSEPLPMRGLAQRRHCDPSNITGLVDRLESKGLVEREPDPSDRRVKRVALTPDGQAALTRFHDELHRISSMAGLSLRQQRRLIAALPTLNEPG